MRLTKRDGHEVWFAHGRPRGFLCPQKFCDNAYGCDKVKDRVCPYLQLLDKLAAYEDAEEQGRLVRLPCKVGTAIWRVWCGKINRYVVVEVDAQDHVKLRFLIECLPYLRFYWDDEYGKTVFLSREEAEAALKGEGKDV